MVTPRGDGAGPPFHESAEEKACTAVSWNASASDPAERPEQAPA